MKMICDRTLLANAVAGVSKAVTQRSSIPVLEGILMKAEGFSLTLTGYDLEMGITTSIEANVLEPGEVVLSAKLLGDMVRRLSSSEVEITATETNATTIKGGITEFDIMGMNPGDFPELPSPGADHTLDLETPTFREMVETTLFAVSQDDKKPAHTGELFAIEPDKLTVVALDGYRLAIIEKPIKAAKDINIIIPAKTLAEAIKLFTDDDEVVHIAANRRFVVFSSRTYTVISRLIEGGGITEFDIMGMNPGDFPELPSPGADHTLDLETPTFREMVETTLFAVSQDDKKPAHTGELFAIEPDKLTVVALDGYRLAIIEKPIKAAKDINIIIPAKTLAEAIKLFTDDDEVVHIAANRRFVVFSSRTYTVISRLIEGDFLDYKRVIPEGYHTRVTVDVRDFSNSIERASLIITERLKNPLRITFDGNITVRCQTTLGKVVDELDAEIEGEPVEIGFNNRYLLDALRYSRCDKLVFEVSGPLSPVKVLPKDGGDFLFLVLPVRFKND